MDFRNPTENGFEVKFEKKEQTLAVGIDLGTTYSCVALYRHGAYGNVEIIQNEQGSRITPSCVAFTSTERLVGEGAFNQIIRDPKNTIFDAKRLIGRRFSDTDVQNDMDHWPFQVVSGMNGKPVVVVEHMGKKKQFLAEKISSMVISKMKETAEIYIGRSVDKAVVTVPAYFNDAQRRTTKDACTIAGLTVMRIINEPTAVAIAYGLLLKEREVVGKKTVFVFDFGGGTFDVSLLKIDSGTVEVKATGGDTHLGGEDINNILVNRLGLGTDLAYIPSIHVTFNINEDGLLNVTARDRSTGFQAGVTITNDSNSLSQEEIDKMVVDAVIYRNEDMEKKKKADAKSGLEIYVYKIRNTIRNVDIGCKLMSSERKAVEVAVLDVLKWSDVTSSVTTEAHIFDMEKTKLENIWNPIKEKLGL